MNRFNAALVVFSLVLAGCSSQEPASSDPSPQASAEEGGSKAGAQAPADRTTQVVEAAARDLSKKLSRAIAKGEVVPDTTLRVLRISRTGPRPRGRRSAPPASLSEIVEQELSSMFTITEADTAELALTGSVTKDEVRGTDGTSQSTYRVTLRVLDAVSQKVVCMSSTQMRFQSRE